MDTTLHITSGDCAGDILAKSGVAGEIFVWHDILYDGPRDPGWPDNETLEARALFLEKTTGGGLGRKEILHTLTHQYEKLATSAADYEQITLWFDACLFDQSMLVHILACLFHKNITDIELICIDAFPEIVPFNGLGQLNASQMTSIHNLRTPVTDDQFQFAQLADTAFATQEPEILTELSKKADPPLPFIPAAVTRWLAEQPDPETGLGRLETLALNSICSGCETPAEIISSVAAADTPPQYWGDITLWQKINALADRNPPFVKIEGPTPRLPQWEGIEDLKSFQITCLSK